MMTDPIADMLTRIRNAQKAGHAKVRIPASKMKEGLLRILAEEGYVGACHKETEKQRQLLVVDLRYDRENSGVIDGLRRISKPGMRVYKSYNDLAPVRGGLGTAVLSTSHGLMTDRDARQKRVGGEVLCEVW